MTAHSPPTEDRKRKLGTRHHRRVVMLLQISGLITSVILAGWMICFALQKHWAATAIFAAAVSAGLLCTLQASKGHIYRSGGILLATLYVMICGVCLFLDPQSAKFARTTHLFLLPLGAGAYMGYRGAQPWLRNGIVSVIFASFTLFACTSIGWTSIYALPDEVRLIGSRIDAALATLALLMVMYVMQADVEARNAYETDLRAALASTDQLRLFYQPQVDELGHVFAAEALLRWVHPRKGMISPAEFIPVAERTGLILPMGLWVLETACSHLKSMEGDARTAQLTLAVNISAHQIGQQDFVVQVLSIIERSGIDPTRLKLELTESVLVHDMDETIAKMNALRKYGVEFSLDDFGTGYSSLSYLKQLPLDQLKIDQAFVRDLLTHPQDLAIAKTIVDLGKSLNIAVIAEGVETEEQRAMLASIDCNCFQGYLFGRPAPFEQLIDRVRQQAASGSTEPLAEENLQPVAEA